MAQISEPLGLFAGSDVGSTKCVACCGLHGGKAGSKLNANFFLVGMLVAVILARLAPSLAKSHGLLHVDTFRVSAAVEETRFTTAKMEVWAERGHYVPLFVGSSPWLVHRRMGGFGFRRLWPQSRSPISGMVHGLL